MRSERRVQILDSTLRESMQAVHPSPDHTGKAVIWGRETQFDIARGLGMLGIDAVEIFAPVDNPYALETSQMIVKEMHANYPRTEMCAHSRCSEIDIDAALETGVDRINLYMGTSEELRGAMKKSVDDIIRTATNAIIYIKAKSPKTKIRFSTEDGFRTNWEDLKKVIKAIAPQVDIIGMPDTTGLAKPHKVFELISKVRRLKCMQDKLLEVHFHNDTANAAANAFEAWRAGADRIDTTILGLGERNGIVALHDLFAEFDGELPDEEFVDKYDLTMVPNLSTYVAGLLGIPIPHTAAIVGVGANKSVAGVHGNGVMINHQTYHGLDLSKYGLGDPSLVYVSATIGGQMLFNRARELGYSIPFETTQNKNIKAHAARLASSIRQTALKFPDELNLGHIDSIIEWNLIPYLRSTISLN